MFVIVLLQVQPASKKRVRRCLDFNSADYKQKKRRRGRTTPAAGVKTPESSEEKTKDDTQQVTQQVTPVKVSGDALLPVNRGLLQDLVT